LEWDSYTRHCNYFQNVENSLDTTHVGFVHRDQIGAFDGRVDCPLVRAEESDWGITFYATRPSGKKFVSQWGMPNIFHLKGLPNEPGVAGVREFLAWWVPIDDARHHQFGVYQVQIPAAAAAEYQQRRAAREAKRDMLHTELAEAILAGRLRLADVDPARTDLVRLQDDVAQVAQGRIADRTRERLGRGDRGVLLIRALWDRELRALAAGRPLEQWHYDPERLQVTKEL